MSHGIFDGCIDRLRGDIRFLLPYFHTMDTGTGEYRSSVHLMRLSLSGSENGVVNLVDLIFRVNNPENTRAKHAGNYAECRFFSSACGLTAAGCWISLPESIRPRFAPLCPSQSTLKRTFARRFVNRGSGNRSSLETSNSTTSE